MERPSFRGNLVRPSEAQRGWLSLRPREPALEPDLPIVDAHHHLMLLPGLGVRYLLDEFTEDLAGGHRILATVCVEGSGLGRAGGPQAFRPVGEVESLRGMAAMAESGHFGPTRVAEAIVGHVDLTLGAAAGDVLDASLQAGGGRLRGIRHATAHDAGSVGRHLLRPCPPHLMGDRAYRAGAGAVQKRGLVLDTWVFHTQLDDVYELARDLPGLCVVLDHAGTLLGVEEHAQSAEAVEQAWGLWRRGMRRLGRLPNVFVKVGGLGMPLVGLPFHRDDSPPDSAALARAWQPYLDTCLEAFGVRRCMLESNFPIDRQSCGYVELWNAFKRMTHALSGEERSALFGGTATQVYRLSA